MMPLFIFLCLFCCTLAIRIREESWYSPFALFGLLWSFIVGFSLLTAPEYFYSSKAIGFIGVCILVFFTGGMLAETWAVKKTDQKVKQNLKGGTWLRMHYSIAVFSGYAALYLLIRDAGLRFSELFDMERLIETSKVLTDTRYAGQRLSALTMFFMMIAYSGCLTAGRLFVFSPKINGKFRALLILIPILLFTVIYTARAILIYALFLFLASIVIHYSIRCRKKALLFGKKNMLIVMGGLAGLALVFFVTQAVRMGITELSSASLMTIFDHLKVWFSGNVSAFSIWFERVDHTPGITGGTNTFAGLNEWLGGKEREVGIYVKSYDLDGHFHFSNIYTVFRFLLDDFDYAGTLLFWLGLGCVSRIVYMKVLDGDFIAASVLTGILTWLLFSFVASVFAYNTVLFAWMLFVLITFVSEKLIPDEAK